MPYLLLLAIFSTLLYFEQSLITRRREIRRMSSDSSSSSSSSSGSSGSSSDSDHKDASDKLNGSMREMSQADDLVSVTVRKTSPTQKAGVSLVERQSRIFITNVTENGLFHGTEIEVGDIVLAINGQRLKKGEGAKEIIQNISKAKTTVTMVVKKANRKARRGVRSLSPSAQMRKKYGTKIHKKAFNRNEDGRYVLVRLCGAAYSTVT